MSGLRIPEKVSQALQSEDVRNLPLPEGKFDCQYTYDTGCPDKIKVVDCEVKEIRGKARKFLKSLTYFRRLQGCFPLGLRGAVWGLVFKGTRKTAGKEYQFSIYDYNMDGRLGKGDAIYLDDGNGNKREFVNLGEQWLEQLIVKSGDTYYGSLPRKNVTKRDVRTTLKPLQAMYQSALRMAGFKLEKGS